MLEEEHVVRLLGRCDQAHVGFIGSAIAFFVVALHTCAREIFPRVVATARAGDDVIYCEWWTGLAAIIAAHAIATEDVLA